MQKYAGQKDQLEQPNRKSPASGGDQEDRLKFAMQKPLKKDQRHKHKTEPDETCKLVHANSPVTTMDDGRWTIEDGSSSMVHRLSS